MQKVPHTELDINFPRKYLQKLEQYREKYGNFTLKPKKKRKPSDSPQVFSSHCKQAISVTRARVYCCALKEMVEGAMCKACPGHEPEPLEYTLFKRE